jgi:asparagine synthase (glutamine-hydrolysing)
MVHRGPDSDGVFVDDSIGLAMRRLAIIDVSGGDQPIGNEDGTVQVIQNGEIYNYRELRAMLRRQGHHFSTASDTEVIVHLYEERGLRFADDLRGMFAVAIWDSRRRRLILARDRFGIKPLYYSFEGTELTFASELKALASRKGFTPEIDLDALEAFLAFGYVPAPLTIFHGIRKLPAGHYLTWSEQSPATCAIEAYALPRPVPSTEVLRGGESELAEELRSRLRDSVRAHLVADVPVGVLLSGGIDSSALAALAALETSGPVRTFSIGFEERSFNELSRARLVARRYGTNHHELVVRSDAVELLPAIAEVFDEPFADSSALPTYLVSKLAAEHVKVALSGEGGDELFGGYYTYVADILAAKKGMQLATRLRPLVERLPSSSRKASLEYKAKRFLRGLDQPVLERHHSWRELFRPEVRAELVTTPRGSLSDPVDHLRSRYSQTTDSEFLARLLDVDVGSYLSDDLLVKVDRASMAHSLEARVPFLDPVVAEFALALPSRMKVRGFSTKRLLRLATAPLVPREIVYGKKHGFSIPAAAWLRGELVPMARELLSPQNLRRQGLFRPEVVERLLDEHAARRDDHSRHLWALLVFVLWFDRYGGVYPRLREPVGASAIGA